MRRTSLVAVVAILLLAIPARARISTDFVHRVIRAHLSEIRACYEQGLSRRRDLAGRVVVGWTVQMNGSVTDVAVQSSTLGDPAVEACIVARVASWRFPESRRGTIQIHYPFELRPAD